MHLAHLNPRHWSIRAKTVGLVAGYVLALCGVYGTLTVSLVRREVVRAHDRLEQTAELVAAELDAYIEFGRQRLITVSRLPGMAHGLRTIQGTSGEGRIPPWTTLHYLFFKWPVFSGGVFLLDRSGKVLWTEPAGQPLIGQVLADHPVIAPVYNQQREVVSGALPSDVLFATPHVVLAVPVRNPDGVIDGVLGGIVDLAAPELAKILAAVSTSEGRFVEVLDPNGARIGGSAPPAKTVRPDAADAKDWMLAVAPLAQAPWRIVVGQPRALALAAVWQSQRMLLGLGLALLLIAVAAGTPIVNGFVRGIQRLTGAAEVMARGDLSRPLEIGRRGDELATLARTFEQMRVELDRSRTALERRLEEREELIRLKEEFVAGISHELRTPLNAIIGYSDMLNDEPLTKVGREYVATVRAQSEHLYRMVADLLTLSGLNTGTLAVEVSPVRIPVVLARLRPLADRLRATTGAEVAWEYPMALPTLETDALRLEQILANLITNALKFTPRGRVTVRVVDQAQYDRVVFEVSDTGIGIPPEEMPYIFDEFRQVDGSLTRRYGGVGLGLSLVRRLTELLHGTVAVRSQPGAGSTFTIELPLHFPPAAASSAAA